MPKTRKQESSEKDAEQPEQVETVPVDTPAPAEPKDEKKEDDATTMARERQERFKALQARAVSVYSGRRRAGAFLVYSLSSY